MKIKPLVKDFIVPEYKREYSGGMDIYLQQDITLDVGADNIINLGFAAEVPEGHIAMLIPRSSTGMKGIALRNTVGIIDADYRGEWIAHITLDSIFVPFNKVEIELSDTLSQTGRGDTGFGGTGK